MMRFLLPIVLIIVAAGLFFGFTSDAIDQANLLEATNAELDQALSNNKDMQQLFEEKNKQFNNFSPDQRKAIDTLLPTGNIDNVRLIIDMDTIAKRHNMALRDARIKSDQNGAPAIGNDTKRYGTVTLSFSVSGSYNDLKLFLTDLQTSLRLVDVSTLSFTASDKDTNEYSFEIRTYWLK